MTRVVTPVTSASQVREYANRIEKISQNGGTIDRETLSGLLAAARRVQVEASMLALAQEQVNLKKERLSAAAAECRICVEEAKKSAGDAIARARMSMFQARLLFFASGILCILAVIV